MSPQSDINNSLNHSGLQEHVKPAVCETVLSAPENTISEGAKSRPVVAPDGTQESGAVALARAIAAVNDLPLAPEAKAAIIRQLAGL